MVFRTRSLVALLAVLVNTPTSAQIAMPTNFDLKAAYCIPVLEMRLGYARRLRDQADGFPASDSKVALLAKLDTYSAGLKTDINRLRAYVVPKVMSLNDPTMFGALTAFATARKRGEQDSSDAIEAGNTCVAKCGEEQSCLQTCIKADSAAARVNTCADLRWLPF